MLLTVVIPTRNRADRLERLLKSLKRQQRVDFQWEVLVMDNGSSDHTVDVIQAFMPGFPVPLRRIYDDIPGLHRGRNGGAMNANGTIVGFLDDDMEVDGHWIQGARLIRDGTVRAVAGKILPVFEADVPDWAKVIYDGKTCGYWGLLDLGDAPCPVNADQIPGGNCFVDRQTVMEIKGFHPDGMPDSHARFRGDGETGFYRIFEKMGYAARYDPIALAYHAVPAARMTLAYIQERAFRQGISDSYSEIRSEGGLRDPLYHLINDAYLKGKLFHREEVRKDPDLLQWILRDNYLDHGKDEIKKH